MGASGRELQCDASAVSTHTHKITILPVLTYIRDTFRKSFSSPCAYTRTSSAGRCPLIGRGNRSYIALEWHTQRFVFLKDTWRPYYEGWESERDILQKLNAAKVANVLTALACGDVCDAVEDLDGPTDDAQETDASNYSPVSGPKKVDWSFLDRKRVDGLPRAGVKRSADEAKDEDLRRQGSDLLHRAHTRLVLKEVCLPAAAFTRSKQLIQAVFDCVLGMS